MTDDELLSAFARRSLGNLNKRFKPTKPAPSESTAPLHAKDLHGKTVQYFEILSFAPHLRRLLQFDTDEAFLRAILAGEDVWAGRVSPIPYADVLRMQRLGYIRKVKAGDILRTGLVFTVLEERADGERRRWILWPWQLNEELEAAGADIAFSLPPMWQHLADGRVATHQMIFDLTMGFNQCRLPEVAQRMHGFCCRNTAGDKEFYVSEVMVMGAKPSPLRLQRVLEAVAGEAVRRCWHTAEGSLDPSAPVTWRVHIDGVRFLGSAADLHRLKAVFVALSDEVGFTLKPESVNEPHTVGEWMGVQHCLTSKTASLTPKTKAKLVTARDRTLASRTTVEAVLAAFGALQHYSVVLRAPLYRWYTAIKFVRRLASDLTQERRNPSDVISLWPTARADFAAWFGFVLSVPSAPLPNRAETQTVFLFTDASKHGWGAVLLKHGVLQHFGGRWSGDDDTTDINALEALAVKHAAERFAADLQDEDVLLLVDNTTTMHSLVHGSARVGRLNAAIGGALSSLGVARTKSIKTIFIETKLNPADAPSRGLAMIATTATLAKVIDEVLSASRLPSQTPKREGYVLGGVGTCAGASGKAARAA